MENIKPLRILYISARSDMGGGPKHMLQLVSNFSKSHNFEVFVAAPTKGVFYKDFKKHAKTFFEIPYRSFSLIRLLRLLFFCRNNEINIIHSHGRGAGIYSKLIGLFGFKVIHSFHGIHEEPGKVGRIKLLVDQFLSPLTTFYISATLRETSKAINCKLGTRENIITIPNGILMSKHSRPTNNSFREKYNISPSVKLWGYLSRISYQKGVDLLVDALKASKELSDYFFIVAGNGEDLDSLRTEIKNHNISNLLLIGQVESPEEMLENLDGYFSFSRGEGLPLSVLEAISYDLPCVLSNVTGHDQFGKELMYFDLANYTDFTKHIINPVKANYDRLKAEYGESKMISRTTEVYRSAHSL